MKRIEQLNNLEFAQVFKDLREKIIEDPVKNFVEASGFINFKPTPAQRVALKIIFGQELDPLNPHIINFEYIDKEGAFRLNQVELTEVEIYEYMTGKQYVVAPTVMRETISDVDLIIGRRGGKSTIAAILATFGALKENWKPYLNKTRYATVLILSHGKEFSQEILEIIRGLVMDSPILNRLIDKKKKNTQTTFNMKIPFLKEKNGKLLIEDSRVQIKVGAASKRTTRGAAICFSLNDEIAYWGTDDKYAETDEDIIRAIRPSLGQFKGKGMMIKLSSPGTKQGVLYDEYQNKEDLPGTFIIFKAPSWVWNDILDDKFLGIEYKLDPNGFQTEYRAEFVDSLSDFIMSDMVDLCVIKNAALSPPEDKKTEVAYVAAIDAAFKGDRFSFSIMGYVNGRFKQYVLKAWEGSRIKPVKAFEIAEFIRNICKEYGLFKIHADQYAFQPLKEIFEQYNLTLLETPFTNTFKKQIYYNLKTMIHNQKVDLLDHKQNIKEIKQLQVEQSSTGTVRIGHPNGGHDDCADVTAICTYLLAHDLHKAGIDMGEIAGTDYEIGFDKHGKTINQAPSAEMLSRMYKSEIFDNSYLYMKDPKTGQYVKKIENEEEEENSEREMGGDFIFA